MNEVTEAQIWVLLGFGSAISVTFLVIARIGFISEVRKSLRDDPGEIRGDPGEIREASSD